MDSESGRGVRSLPFDVVDVFADAPFAGNQLAVVHGATGLPDAVLLAVAQEFGFSETTFPEPLGAAGYRVRIFTASDEIPFAGHPTLGTAWVLRQNGALAESVVTQQCGAGEVRVRLDAGAAGDLVELSTRPGDLVGPLPDDAVAALLADIGLAPSDRDGETWVAGTGLDFVHLPVRADAVARARPGRIPIAELVAGLDLTAPLEGLDVHAVAGAAGAAGGVQVHARVFVPGLGVTEDAATGSSAAGLGLALVARGVLADGGDYEIRQGIEMGRPSRLLGRVDAEAGVPSRVHVGGRVFGVAQGTIDVPVP